MAAHKKLLKLGMVLGEAIPPYDRTYDRVRALVEKSDPDTVDAISDALLSWFHAGQDGSGLALEASKRRAQAVAWALERFEAIPEWLVAAGVDLEDSARAELEDQAPAE